MSKPILDKGVEEKSSRLRGKRIAIGASGGIGAVGLVKIFRELRRHGAKLCPFATPSVFKFITPLSLSWAADHEVVCQPDESVEHFDAFDLVVVAPATLNTLSKCATGITDNAVTLLVAAAIGGGIPVVAVPTMNVRLLRHPSYANSRKTLESWGVEFFEAETEEDRLKMPAPEALVSFLINKLSAK
ncbi:MAG: flavoprotein [Bdellovibrionota bacterium]